MRNPFRCFNSSPEVIRLTVMSYVRYPHCIRSRSAILMARIGSCPETMRFTQDRFGPMFAAAIRKPRLGAPDA